MNKKLKIHPGSLINIWAVIYITIAIRLTKSTATNIQREKVLCIINQINLGGLLTFLLL
jgi:hypothetical protein